MDIFSINADELAFDCTLDRYQDEIKHPETEETLREDFPQSGHKIACQHPELFLHRFSTGGGYTYWRTGGKGGVKPSVDFVLFAGDKRFGFTARSDKDFAEDGVTRIWEICIMNAIVYCYSPFSHLCRQYNIEREKVAIVEPDQKFSSREEQDQVMAIIVKALSAYNHKEEGETVRIDGQDISREEHKERIKLRDENRDQYDKTYRFEEWIEKQGAAQVNIASYVQEKLENGELIA